MTAGVLLVSHGTVDNLDDLGAFVTKVRRGHAPPSELVAELRRRYEAVGGQSPLNAINAELAEKLSRRLGLRVAWASRLWKPYTRDVIAALAREQVTHLVLMPLAQHSASIYEADAKGAAEAVGMALACVSNWGQCPKLCDAFVSRILAALDGADASSEPVATAVVMTAHSLPQSVIDAGDPYEREVRAAADTIAAGVRARSKHDPHFIVSFQSQGFAGKGPGGRSIPWLGPDLATALDEAKARGVRRVVFAPTGFLADHVEVLYDLDIEARAMAGKRGLAYGRMKSLNADDDFVDVLADVVLPLLESVRAAT